MYPLNLKQKLQEKLHGNTKDVEITVPLKYLSNFWRTLEMPLIICEISLILTWWSTGVVTNSTGARTFSLTDANFMFQ